MIARRFAGVRHDDVAAGVRREGLSMDLLGSPSPSPACATAAIPAGSIDRPIFILGPHRSGTTLLYEILARHPDVGYFNRANRRLPCWPGLAHLWARTLRQDKPMEAQNIWDRFWTGDDDHMDRAQADVEAIEWYRALVARTLAWRGARRFLAKYPRLSLRLDWLDAVFPGAVFVHLQRDWRAVVNSTVERQRRRSARQGGWFGVRIPGWRTLGELPPEIIAGRIYRHVTNSLESEGVRRGARFAQCSYEALCRAPETTLRAVAEHCGLAWSDAFFASVPRIASSNHKWREQLDPALIERIRQEDEAFFRRHEDP